MITKIGEAVLAVISAWVPGASVADNVLSVLGVFAGHASDLGVNPVSPIVKDALKIEASVAAINAGQPAILGTVDFDGKTLSVFAIDSTSPIAAQVFGTGGPAAGV